MQTVKTLIRLVKTLISDWADAKADLSLRWAHTPLCWFCHEAAQKKVSSLTCCQTLIFELEHDKTYSSHDLQAKILSAQSDQSLCCSCDEALGPWL